MKFLLNLFEKVVEKEIDELNKELIRIKFIGDLSPFSEDLRRKFINAENITYYNNQFTLNICTNYGGRQELVKVAKELSRKSISGEIKPDQINEEMFESHLLTYDFQDPDLLIRTSGEKRISNFLLWQLAYSEIYIADVLWPEFDDNEFYKAIIDYQSRNRRFGGIKSVSNQSLKSSFSYR